MLSLFRKSSVASARRAFSTSPTVRSDIAKVTLLGFIGTEPEVASLSDGREIIRYTVGVSRGINKGVSWFRVSNFDVDGRGGKEYLATLPKGTRVFVEGNISLRPYETEDGKKHAYVDVFQQSITCLARPNPDKKRRREEESVEE